MGQNLLRLRFLGWLAAAVGIAFIVLSLTADYQGEDAGPRAIDLSFGVLGLVAGYGFAWAGFADEAGTVGNFRAKQAALVWVAGVVVGGIVGLVVGMFI